MQFSGLECRIVCTPIGASGKFGRVLPIDVNREIIRTTCGLRRTSIGGPCGCPENERCLFYHVRIYPHPEMEIGDAAIWHEFLRPVLRIWIRSRRDAGFREPRISPSIVRAALCYRSYAERAAEFHCINEKASNSGIFALDDKLIRTLADNICLHRPECARVRRNASFAE